MFALNVQDLYYSIPRQELCSAVQECIEDYGGMTFQNECDVGEADFVKLLRLCLLSVFLIF